MPEDELAQIWELADLDGDGKLHLDEWAIAMHLVSRRVAGDPLPATLPSSLRPPFAWEAAAKVTDAVVSGVAAGSTAADDQRWSMSAADRRKYEGVFRTVLRSSSEGGFVELAPPRDQRLG